VLVFQVLTAWKGDALLAQQHPQPLVRDVLDHPLGDLEVGQLRQAPDRERQPVIGRPAQRDPLDLGPLRGGRTSAKRAPTAAVAPAAALNGDRM
jgi:hypothetical protein